MTLDLSEVIEEIVDPNAPKNESTEDSEGD
jgi:hypothetical protein